MSERRFEIEGVILEIPEALLVPALRRAFDKGVYEKKEAKLLASMLRPDDVILEVGAGVGFLSSLAKLKHPQVRVFAVEANPSLIPVIKKNHELNKVEVSVFHEVLGKEAGVSQFTVSDAFWGSSKSGSRGGTTIEVPMTPFSARLEEAKPTLLVVDIEGGELELFSGEDLPGVRQVMMELHQNVLRGSGMKKVFDYFSERNFHYNQKFSNGSVVTFTAI